MKLIFLAIDKYLTDVSKYVMDISVTKYNIIHLFEFKS